MLRAPDSGPVSLVGWVRSQGVHICSGESEFQVRDLCEEYSQLLFDIWIRTLKSDPKSALAVQTCNWDDCIEIDLFGLKCWGLSIQFNLFVIPCSILWYPICDTGFRVFSDAWMFHLMLLFLQFSDGTGHVIVRMDVPTEKEEWLLPQLKLLVPSENSEDQENQESPSSCSLRYLRLIAVVSQHLEHDCIVVRWAYGSDWDYSCNLNWMITTSSNTNFRVCLHCVSMS